MLQQFVFLQRLKGERRLLFLFFSSFLCLSGFSGDRHAQQRWPFWGVRGQAGRPAALDVGGDAVHPAGGQRRRLPGPLYLQRHHGGLPRTGSEEHAKEYPPQHRETVSNNHVRGELTT